MSAIKLPVLEPPWPVPSALLAPFTCASVCPTSPVSLPSQPGSAGFLQHLALPPGALDRCPPLPPLTPQAGSQPATRHHCLAWGRAPEIPSILDQAPMCSGENLTRQSPSGAHGPVQGSWGNKGQARPFPESPAPSLPSVGSQGTSFLSSFLPSFA